jgi:hypothetical protein
MHALFPKEAKFFRFLREASPLAAFCQKLNFFPSSVFPSGSAASFGKTRKTEGADNLRYARSAPFLREEGELSLLSGGRRANLR